MANLATLKRISEKKTDSMKWCEIDLLLKKTSVGGSRTQYLNCCEKIISQTKLCDNVRNVTAAFGIVT